MVFCLVCYMQIKTFVMFVALACFFNNGFCANKLLGTAGRAVKGTTSSSKSTLGDLSTLVKNTGNAFQDILNASRQTNRQIQETKKQLNIGRKKQSDKNNEKVLTIYDQKEKQLISYKKQVKEQSDLKIKTLQEQLKKEQARQKADIKEIDQKISEVRLLSKQAKEKEATRLKSEQILANLKKAQAKSSKYRK